MKKVIWLVLALCFVASLALAQGMVKDMASEKPMAVAGEEMVNKAVTTVTEGNEVITNTVVTSVPESEEEAVEQKAGKVESAAEEAAEGEAPAVEKKEMAPEPMAK